jgi:Protein of unknown function (DUF2795)
VAHEFATQSPVTIAQYLVDLDFPASRQEVVWSAQLRDAQEDVLRLLRRIPNQQYTDLAHVMNNLSRAGVKRLARGRVIEWRGSR